MHHWNATTVYKNKLSLGDYFEGTTIFELYERDHKGQKLTMDLINQMIVISNTNV